MKCFYHHESDSVGICKNCNRGLCPGCAVEVPDGLACSGKCEEAVTQVSALISRNTNYAANGPRAGSIWKMMGVVFSALGIAMLLQSLSVREPTLLRSLTPILFIAWGIGCFVFGRRVSRSWDDAPEKPPAA